MLFRISLLAAAVAAGWGLTRLWRILAIGAAYRSKVLCSILFGSRRAVDPQRADDVSRDSYRLLRLFRSRVDEDARTVTTSCLGFRPRTAGFRPGFGATLFIGEPRAALGPGAGPPALPARAAAPLPVRTGRNPALNRVVDAAFSEPDSRRLRRTRAVVVLQDGDIVAERYAGGFGPAMPLPGWSMTKSVLNALVGILVAEQRISLTDRALMPVWQPPDPRAAITVEDLLRMRSGLKFSEDYADFSSDVIEMLFNRADAAGYAAALPLVATPGSMWSYASGTSNILSAVVRKAVGEAEYQAWPRRVLFDPVGMESAILEPDAAGTFVCSSFMLATARDWARFGQLFLQDGVWEGRRILPEGWVAFSTTPTRQAPSSRFGAHWWLKLAPEIGGDTAKASRLPRDAYFAVGHEAQILTVIPSRRLVVVRLGLSIYIDAWDHAAFLDGILEAID